MQSPLQIGDSTKRKTQNRTIPIRFDFFDLNDLLSHVRKQNPASSKRSENAHPLTKLLEEWLAEDDDTFFHASPSVDCAQTFSRVGKASRGHSGGRGSITEIVEGDENLCRIFHRMAKLQYLLPSPLGLLFNTTQIKSNWEKSPSRDAAIGSGIFVWYQFHSEGVKSVDRNRPFKVSSKTKVRCAQWLKKVNDLFPDEAKFYNYAAYYLGKYLQHNNRKIHGLIREVCSQNAA